MLQKRYAFEFLILATGILFVLDIMLGPVGIPFREVIDILAGRAGPDDTSVFIIHKIRLPKALTAMLAGSALAVSGLQMQTLFRNPLASPSELGITSGATLGIGLLIFAGGLPGFTSHALRESGIGASWLVILMASLGSAFTFLLLLAVARKVRDQVVVLIAGVMMGTLTLSIVSIWQYHSQPEQLQTFILWTFGALGGVTGSQLGVFSLTVCTGLAASFLLSKPLNMLLLGESYAQSMGLPILRTRLLILTVTCILTGSVTAFCGPIGFVGIAVPHLTRALLGTANHRLLVPACCITGCMLMLVCDILSQFPGNQMTLPVNVVTSFIGAPVVLWIIIRKNNLGSSF